jgi:hypothetical protein
MTKVQEKILKRIQEGHTVIGGKYARTLKALEKQGKINIISREEKTTHIKDFKEYVIHGQYRMGEIQKKVKYVIYNVELVKE